MPRAATHHRRAKPDAVLVPRAAYERLVKADVVVLTRADYERLVEAAEMAIDVAESDASVAAIAAGATLIPDAVVAAELDGAHPVKAWRKHRRLTLKALAASAGVSAGQISLVENRRRAASVAFLGRLAKVFGCTAGDLVED